MANKRDETGLKELDGLPRIERIKLAKILPREVVEKERCQIAVGMIALLRQDLDDTASDEAREALEMAAFCLEEFQAALAPRRRGR